MDSHVSFNDPTAGDQPSHVVSNFQKRVIGDSVLIRQGGAQTIEANQITIRQGGVVNSKAEHLIMNAGGSIFSQANTIELNNSTAGILLTKGESNLDQSSVQVFAAGGEVKMDQCAAAVLAARDVEVKNSAVVFLIAKNVNGPVNPMFGPREAVVFGAVAGIVGGIAVLLGRLFRKK